MLLRKAGGDWECGEENRGGLVDIERELCTESVKQLLVLRGERGDDAIGMGGDNEHFLIGNARADGVQPEPELRQTLVEWIGDVVHEQIDRVAIEKQLMGGTVNALPAKVPYTQRQIVSKLEASEVDPVGGLDRSVERGVGKGPDQGGFADRSFAEHKQAQLWEIDLGPLFGAAQSGKAEDGVGRRSAGEELVDAGERGIDDDRVEGGN